MYWGDGSSSIPVAPSLTTPSLCSPTVEGQWLEWGAWSRCSVTCANGTQQRTRRCSVAAHGWAECKGAHADARECANAPCPSKRPGGGGGKSGDGAGRQRAVGHNAQGPGWCEDAGGE